MNQIKRFLSSKINKLINTFPAVAILGPRQVGKTTLALEITKSLTPAPLYLDLERPSDLNKLSDPEIYLTLNNDRLIILDEIQRVPTLFPVLRSLIDERRRLGQQSNQYLLLGSASQDLIQYSSESLAGRLTYIELHGFNALEINEEPMKLWLRGGFPTSFLATDHNISFLWRESLIRTYLEREIPQFGQQRIPAETLRRFWSMIAYNQGELFNAAHFAANLGVSSPTISRYLDLLADVFLVRILRPWSNNLGKRLVKSPKVYLRDSGLLHALLNIKNIEELLSHPTVGGSWEGFIIENIASCFNSSVNLWFYRTAAGAEIDLLIEFSPTKLIAIEIKRSLSPSISTGLRNAIDDLKPYKTFIVYPGDDCYKLNEQIEVISLQKIMVYLLEQLV
jgi:predicted AAA+ superfamily ATPase